MVNMSKPVFIVGMNGSGTTLMLNCLNAHPELYGFPRESKTIPYYYYRKQQYGDLAVAENFRRLWDDYSSQSCFQWVPGAQEDSQVPEPISSLPRTLATVIDETFSYFAHRHGKQRWCEKTPMYAQHIKILHEMFPHACFIHMIRDGRSCAVSFHRRWGYNPKRTVYRWKRVIRAARGQAEESGARYMEVFYENLAADPATEMRKVCEFIGVEYDEKVLSPSRRPAHSGSSADGIVKSSKDWKKYLKPSQIVALENIAGRTLCDLGYPVDNIQGDRNPPAALLKIWTVRDYMRPGFALIWRQLTMPKKYRWDSLGGAIQKAIRQKRSSRF